jgi:hypothetical protein
MRNRRAALSAMSTALHGGERLLASIPAMVDAGHGAPIAGMLALTSERVVFHGMTDSARDHAVPLNAVIAVDFARGLVGHVTFITVTGSVRFEINARAGARWLAGAQAQLQRAALGARRVTSAA